MICYLSDYRMLCPTCASVFSTSLRDSEEVTRGAKCYCILMNEGVRGSLAEVVHYDWLDGLITSVKLLSQINEQLIWKRNGSSSL